MKRIIYVITLLIFCVSLSFARAADRPLRETGKEAGLMLDLQKMSLGTLANVEQRRQYLSTVQLEKQRIQNFTLNMVYDNAYDMYKQGDYQRAAEISDVILSIDPSMKKAKTLSNTATKMAEYGTLSEKEILDMKYREAYSLYKQGYLVEAQSKFEEILTLNPHEEQARVWIERINNEFTKIHTRRGYYAYKQGDYQEALNQWYNVLLIRKDDPVLNEKIAEVENLIKKEDSQRTLEKAFEYYSKGRLVDAYREFNLAHQIYPGEQQTQKFIVQLKEEIANNYYNAGNKAYNEKKYNTAIANWREAQKWGYSQQDILVLIRSAQRAKSQSSSVTTGKTQTTVEETKVVKEEKCPPCPTLKCKPCPKVFEENKTGTIQEVLPVAKTSNNKEVATTKTVVTNISNTPEGTTTTTEVTTKTEVKEGSSDKLPPVNTEIEGEKDDFPTQTIVDKTPPRVSEAARQASIKHYRYGLKAFSEGNFEKAKEEWQAALNLNPENSDASLGLKRVEEKYSNR